jgi:hypothetical protein
VGIKYYSAKMYKIRKAREKIFPITVEILTIADLEKIKIQIRGIPPLKVGVGGRILYISCKPQKMGKAPGLFLNLK